MGKATEAKCLCKARFHAADAADMLQNAVQAADRLLRDLKDLQKEFAEAPAGDMGARSRILAWAARAMQDFQMERRAAGMAACAGRLEMLDLALEPDSIVRPGIGPCTDEELAKARAEGRTGYPQEEAAAPKEEAGEEEPSPR